MEVTKNNFESIYPDIVRDIEAASFLCIDGEFTGLNNGSDVSAFATPSESYLKIKAGSLDFLFIQFGLSIFTRDEKTGRYKNRTYVFYLFPRPMNKLAPDARFLCQASSLDFLATNNFDFNKLFKEGIPYLNSTDESSLSDALETKRNYMSNLKNCASHQSIPVPKQYKPIVDDAMKKMIKVVKGLENEVKIEKCSGFVRKLIYQTFQEKFGSPEGILLKSENGTMICKQGKEVNIEEKDAMDIRAAIGFSKVIREISSKGKLVVGHNMLLDLCHLVHRFLDPLPNDYHSFKEMLHCLFPNIIDTKFICSEDPLRQILASTTLEALLETMSKPPFHLPDIDEVEGYCYRGSSGSFHNAGYDAYVTGKVFLSLVRALDPDNKKCTLTNCTPLERFKNKIYLMKAPDTCVDLVHPDPEPRRDHVFHISFPNHWTSNLIAKVFSPFGSVQLYWLSDTTAWVSLHQKEESARAAETLENSSTLPLGVTVFSYHRYMREKGAATSPRPNKRKSGGEPSCRPPDGKRKRKSSTHETSQNGSMRRPSPIPEETPTAPDLNGSGFKALEDAANIKDNTFGMDGCWN